MQKSYCKSQCGADDELSPAGTPFLCGGRPKTAVPGGSTDGQSWELGEDQIPHQDAREPANQLGLGVTQLTTEAEMEV